MATKKNKSKSLSDKIAESFIPRSFKDPELDSEDETAAKLVEGDDEDYEFNRNDGLSSIRKRNVKFLSEFSDKYRGKISSRKEFEDSESEELANEENNTKENDGDEDDLEEYRNRLKNYQIDSEPDEFIGTDEEIEEEKNNSESGTEDDDSDYDSSGSGDVESEESDIENEENTELLKDNNQSDDIQKGLSVQNQLKIWEKLLEVRIHSQKIVLNANSLPQPDVFNTFYENNKDFLKLAEEAQQNVSGLLEKMIEMQQLLLKQYPETKNLAKSSSPIKRKKTNEDEDSKPTKKFANELCENFENFRSYRNSVLQKWHDRTKILTPGASNKGKSHSSNSFDVVKKIEAVLFNKNDLIKKSQIVKGNYTIFGQKANVNNLDKEQNEEEIPKDESVVCPEIYDDTDFYHQQLRELIEFKTNSLTNPSEMSKQFAELQKLRHKMKKKVDTRASKGRKIRLVNSFNYFTFILIYYLSNFHEEIIETFFFLFLGTLFIIN